MLGDRISPFVETASPTSGGSSPGPSHGIRTIRASTRQTPAGEPVVKSRFTLLAAFLFAEAFDTGDVGHLCLLLNRGIRTPWTSRSPIGPKGRGGPEIRESSVRAPLSRGSRSRRLGAQSRFGSCSTGMGDSGRSSASSGWVAILGTGFRHPSRNDKWGGDRWLPSSRQDARTQCQGRYAEGELRNRAHRLARWFFSRPAIPVTDQTTARRASRRCGPTILWALGWWQPARG